MMVYTEIWDLLRILAYVIVCKMYEYLIVLYYVKVLDSMYSKVGVYRSGALLIKCEK